MPALVLLSVFSD